MDTNYETEEHDQHHHHGASCDGIHVFNTNPKYFINPEIIEKSKEISAFKEGCLSFPKIRADIERPSEIKLKYLDFKGEEKIEDFSGIEATCLQHEIDHLNGITFIDHLSYIYREMVMKKLQKIKRHG